MNIDDFAQALRSPGLPPATRRFAVYRNNVASALTTALADGFPVVAQLVGEAFFAALARAYIRHEPPTSPVLVAWADGFGAFIDGFDAAGSLPYLGDVARLERLRVHAFHAADAAPLAADVLEQALARPASLPMARLALQPGLGLSQSNYPVAAIWAAHQLPGETVLPDWQNVPGDSALVLRQGSGWAADVVVVPVPAATAQFVGQLRSGQTLGDAAQANPALDLAFSLGLLIRHQALVGWQQAEESKS